MNSSSAEPLDQDPRARAAVLAGVAEDRHRRRRRGGPEVGVGEDDVRRLAAELERHPLDRRRGPGRDPAPDLGRAGEGDLGDVGVLDQPLPADAAGPGDDVEHALGQPGLERDPLELDRAQRRQLGRLEDDRVAGGERRRDLPGGDRQREVPGHDQADDAERLAEGHVDAAGDRDRLPEQPLRPAGVVAEGFGDHLDLAAGVGDRLADVARLGQGQLFAVLGDVGGEAVEERRPVGRRDRAPGRECLLRPRHRSVGLLDPGPRQLGDLLLGRGIDDAEGLAGHQWWTSDRAAATSAPITRSWMSSSGCQITPRTKLRPGSSIASIRSSSTERPVTSSPSPTSSTPW